MRKFVIHAVAATALLAGAAPAFAQDATDWNGFYAGVFGGGALDTAQASSTDEPTSTITAGDDGNTVTYGSSSSTGRIAGGFGGARAGYNYQNGIIVVGGETSVSAGGVGKSNSSNIVEAFTDNGGVGDDSSFSVNFDSSQDYRINWMASLEGRIGVVPMEGWLFYLKGGVVLADASAHAESSFTSTGASPFGLGGPGGEFSGSSSNSGLLIGKTIGIGAEAMLTDNISASLEYSYVNLPDFQTTAPTIGGILGGLGGGIGGTSGAVFTNQIHTLKAGVNYHF